jgi:hypothetical protein
MRVVATEEIAIAMSRSSELRPAMLRARRAKRRFNAIVHPRRNMDFPDWWVTMPLRDWVSLVGLDDELDEACPEEA